jgi:hypothetical protein
MMMTVMCCCGSSGFSSIGETDTAPVAVPPLLEVQEPENYFGNYRGTATTTVTYLDTWGNVLGEATYEYEIEVIISRPIEGGGMVESNPLSLHIAPVGIPDEEGQLEIHSAHVFTMYDLLEQYWDLQLTGGGLSGQLISTHKEESAVLNFLNVALSQGQGGANVTIPAFPRGMNLGSTLRGTIEGGQIDLYVEGSIISGAALFEARIVAD